MAAKTKDKPKEGEDTPEINDFDIDTEIQHDSLIKALKQAVADMPPYVLQDKKNTMQNYTYLSEAETITHARKVLKQNGLVLVPNSADVTFNGQYTTSKGTLTNRVCIKISYGLYHSDTKESMPVVGLGEGTDSGDKATYKANTGAYKYALRQLLMVVSGNDAEKVEKDDEPPATPANKGATGANNKPSGGSTGGNNAAGTQPATPDSKTVHSKGSTSDKAKSYQTVLGRIAKVIGKPEIIGKDLFYNVVDRVFDGEKNRVKSNEEYCQHLVNKADFDDKIRQYGAAEGMEFIGEDEIPF